MNYICNQGKTYQIYPNIKTEKVCFINRYGINVVGNLFYPANFNRCNKYPAIIVSGAFGAVKEQCSGLYAQEFASMGFVSIAFDPSYTGESGGHPRNVASPDIHTEDYSAAVDFIGLLKFVDCNRIGAMAICGLSGMAITATAMDIRIKAVATASMYDMSRSMSKGYRDSYTREDIEKIKVYLSCQRWVDAENKCFAVGPHEIEFDANGNIIKTNKVLPDILPPNPNPIVKDFYSYYKTQRGYHKNSINSNTAWTATTPIAFFNFSFMERIKEISPRPILLIAGEIAHSRYYSEDVYEEALEPKGLIIVPDATHCDLYDNKEKIPFDELRRFFEEYLV
jgi:fermentation-respiration switch protein FrsA (DUF1100 family)